MTIDEKRSSLRFAGASTVGRGTPWGTLAEVAARALARDYEVVIEPTSWGPNNGRWVADGRADLGAWHLTHLLDLYRGAGIFSGEAPRDNLRVIANINHPSWLGVALREGCGIESLGQIVDDRRPVRIRRGNGRLIDMVLEYYGLTKEFLAATGGEVKEAHEREGSPDTAAVVEPRLTSWARDQEFDLIVDSVYSGFPPEIAHWSEASVFCDLRFMALPEDLIATMVAEGKALPGFVPHRLLRGIWYDVPTVARLPHVIYGREETPEALAYEVAQALDSSRQLFRQCHLAYSLDPDTVAVGHGVPFHEGALRYYGEAGYVRD